MIRAASTALRDGDGVGTTPKGWVAFGEGEPGLWTEGSDNLQRHPNAYGYRTYAHYQDNLE